MLKQACLPARQVQHDSHALTIKENFAPSRLCGEKVKKEKSKFKSLSANSAPLRENPACPLFLRGEKTEKDSLRTLR